MKQIKILFIIFTGFFFYNCSSLTLKPAEFGWPIEAVLKIDNQGFVKEERHSVYFNTKELFLEEMQDSLSYAGKTLRLIRNNEGYYFMTSVDFKNVYIFSADKDSFVLEKKIQIDETGMPNPVFNQRSLFIELITNGKSYRLTSDGIQGGD
ncbi:MAG TPA: hypothetical protein PK073_07055 [Ignavibacteriaceae bacterium]|jgi:hypothetical protein|nr:MAG: hypothetical protein BWY38_02107 [Ignavibacteria bacterium ADurb.Bin266]OQY73024.1 MAG: hypothetical protein B6D44_08570 [Ignavibacteriales bacterium UTCHB2]HQF42656.1 hypothetical protein [Ignavibacteriaceae bacterium]HQI41104.1 hypothetical protein [Ignavibacteriaceae bacterium]HQJ45284.1 hypothetical protein [Ignavibacteriaceae bacterium]